MASDTRTPVRRGGGVTVFVLIVLVAAGVLFALNYHVVTTSKGTFIVPKKTMSLNDTFVDTRNWGWKDLWRHRQTAVALVDAGHADALPQVERFNRAVAAGVQTLQEFDTRFGVSEKLQRAQEGLQKLDARYGVSERIEQTGQALRNFDQEHHVRDRVQAGVGRAADKAAELLKKVRDE